MERDQQELAQGLEWDVVEGLKDKGAWLEIRPVLVLLGIAFAQSAESALLINWERRATK
jgi:hypothetical protein